MLAGELITYTITITNAGPTAPVTATVLDMWTPVEAVAEVYAPGCVVNLAVGEITCIRKNLGTGSALLPSPYLVFTTSGTFSGTLENSASVTTASGITDTNPDNNIVGPVVVAITSRDSWTLYLPVVYK